LVVLKVQMQFFSKRTAENTLVDCDLDWASFVVLLSTSCFIS